MKRILLLLCTLWTACLLATGADKLPGRKSEWHGQERRDFYIEGRKATVVIPKTPLPGNPWIWRPAFFDAFPSIDIELLKRGYHITYFDVTDEWGRPEAIEAGNKFYNVMVNDLNLMPKVTMEGLSRGGFFSLRWAQENPETVACLLLDNPLVDVFTRKGNKDWADFLAKWGIEEATPDTFRKNPVFNLSILIDAGIPILALAGGSDSVIVYEDHIKPITDAYSRWNAPIKVIVRPHSGHHPHGLEYPAAAAEYITRCTYPDSTSHIRPIRVACIGNSITYGSGLTDRDIEAYPSRLQQLLGSDYEVRNFGVSGATAIKEGRNGEDISSYIEFPEFRSAIKFAPDIVIIKLGTNDSKDYNWEEGKSTFINDYQAIIDSFKYLPTLPKIYICLPIAPKTSDAEKCWGINSNVLKNEIIPILRQIAFDNRLEVIDLWDTVEGEENFTYSDYVHPNARGANLIAQRISRIIKWE